jgi:hypothetical protein
MSALSSHTVVFGVIDGLVCRANKISSTTGNGMLCISFSFIDTLSSYISASWLNGRGELVLVGLDVRIGFSNSSGVRASRNTPLTLEIFDKGRRVADGRSAEARFLDGISYNGRVCGRYTFC